MNQTSQPALPRTPLLGWRRLQSTFDALRRDPEEASFPDRLLQSIGVHYRVSGTDLERIPRTGPAVIVANHPFGMVETAALAAALRAIRADIRFLANSFVAAVPELRNIIIPVSLEARSALSNAAPIRQAVGFLRTGGLLVVFPAGAVSHFQWRKFASVDPEWNPAVARILAMAARGETRPVVIPVYVPGSNSPAFHAAGMVHPKLRTAFLAHEFFNKRGREVELRIGNPVSAAKLLAFPSDRERMHFLRTRTYLLASRGSRPLPDARRAQPAQPAEVVAAIPPDALEQEIAQLPAGTLLAQSGELSVYQCDASRIPTVLREIGRLRELTFRAAGEGTGNRLDLDRFDWYYQHLFVWNAETREIVGAYRLCTNEDPFSLYTRTLFQFDQRFLNAMGPAIELGRSFIRLEYQRSFSPLLLLWKGIGRFVAANPEYKVLFGPVSISNQYQSTSRELMISFLEREAPLDEWKGLVRARHAPRRHNAPIVCQDVEELSQAVADLEPNQTGIPVLLRQYLRLGGRLLGFSVDRTFSNVLDGLIVVDLSKTNRKLLERYFGKSEAAAFLAYHRG